MQKNLAQALAYIDGDEGSELNLSPNEPGGSSKHGVSMTVLQEWHKAKGLPPPTIEDMKAVNSKLAGEIYTERFAKPLRFDELPSGVDYRIFDVEVNLGVTGGIKALQRALGITTTGRMDGATIDAANAKDPAQLIKDIGTTWLSIKRESPGWPKYGKGWTNRHLRAEPRALAMVLPPKPELPNPAAQPPKAPPMDYTVKGKAGNWKGIIGIGLTVQQFREYVTGLKFTDWKPSFMVLHNTGAPKLSQWHSHPGSVRMANLTNYYKNEQRWSGGPHAFVANDLIWLFTPMTGPGVHTPSWNGISLGIELVGDYNVEDDDAGIGHDAYMNAVAVFAIVHARLGLNPETIRFHKEDKATTHDCPGKDIVKSKFIQDVIEFMGEAGGHPEEIPIKEPAAPPANTVPKKTAVVNTDNLNLRVGSSAASASLAKLKKGTNVTVNRSAMNGETSWTSVIADGKWGWVASKYLTLN